jgi:hypothetical protein
VAGPLRPAADTPVTVTRARSRKPSIGMLSACG